MRAPKSGSFANVSGSIVSTANSGIRPTIERIFNRCIVPSGSSSAS